MYVTKIEFEGFRPGAPLGAHNGAVTLIFGDTRMQIPLTVPRQIEIEESRARLRLLAEALRKARRIPGFQGKMRFAPGVLPPELRRKIAISPHMALAKRRASP
ncbi:hypothetical protein [Tropicibacter naphthalenivorans]|uniref:Uncharacterized protein n=1 Tax=Tropicibacter naphthalenivorans TaxID=441103 RepID=A0A0P1GEU1_9RHOB|nr:hypothetical protein [Tropicibacter naphthalenivorans]CUH79943.1 hypothetical protein TRN7648_02726 [Tropicibacter naphthalenivorans]SMC76298.1 hypothetical protein SAMN04488093_103356 [Tropicibacter naphthalenivorans]